MYACKNRQMIDVRKEGPSTLLCYFSFTLSRISLRVS